MKVVHWIMGLIDTLFINFILGLALAMLVIKSHWLDMRVNAGALILVLLVFVSALYIVNSKYKIHRYFYWQGGNRYLAILVSSVLVIIVTNGFSIERLKIVLAYTIREGFFMNGASLSQLNYALIVCLLLGTVNHLYYYKSQSLHSKSLALTDEKSTITRY